MTSVAVTLARWAAQLEPAPGEEELAGRSLRDTVAVTLAARDHRVTRLAAGLPAEKIAVAMALAVPAAGGVQRAFGTDAKSLQVGFAVEAGIHAARLAPAGAQADPAALDTWLGLVGGDPAEMNPFGPIIPNGLAIKLYPPTADQLQAKLADCVRGLDTDPADWTWDNAADVLRRFLPAGAGEGSRHG